MKQLITGGKSEYLDGLNENNIAGFVLAIDESSTAFTKGSLLINKKDFLEFNKDHLNALTAAHLGVVGQLKGTKTIYFAPYYGHVSAVQMDMPLETDLIVVYRKSFLKAKYYKLPDGTHVTRINNGHYVIVSSESGEGKLLFRFPDGASVFNYADAQAISKALWGSEGYGVSFPLGGNNLYLETDFAGYLTVIEEMPQVRQVLETLISGRVRPAPIRRPVRPVPIA